MSALTAIMATGCSSGLTDNSRDSDPDTSNTQDVATAPDASSILADAARTRAADPDDVSRTDGASTYGASADGATTDNTDSASPNCSLEGGPNSCVLTCTDASVTCVVAYASFSCELEEFAEASATVACGQTATVGTACCGACGCVAVEVFYDGKRCWEGIPDCSQGTVEGQWFDPRAP
jgi:hypothetical protein